MCILHKKKFTLNTFSSIEQPFNFGRDCFICGHECQVKPDPKNPNRWKKNPVILCKTADRGQDNFGKDRKTFKEVLLEVRYLSKNSVRLRNYTF